jgi:hypothetical protein
VKGGGGRGTVEMKTNDVTNRYTRGRVGFGIEVGRPGVGARIKDMERIAVRLASCGAGVQFEDENPVTWLMSDRATGRFKQEALEEKVLSGIIEFAAEADKIVQILEVLNSVASEIETVFSIAMITRAEDDESLPNVQTARAHGYWVSPNAKVNIGLGRADSPLLDRLLLGRSR